MTVNDRQQQRSAALAGAAGRREKGRGADARGHPSHYVELCFTAWDVN